MPEDHEEDPVGLVQMAPLEPRRALDLADPERGADAERDEGREHVGRGTRTKRRSPSSGRSAAGSTIAIVASTIEGSRTMNPQKIVACISPGTAFWKSLR